MENPWTTFASQARPLFFSGDPSPIADDSSSSGGLSEILGTTKNGGVVTSLSPNTSTDSSLIALKLGRALAATARASAPKRARTRGFCAAQTASFCQVLGCNMDLSGSKDYHKKHKVCDVHSKTSVVIVNGVEQRFCQQCSRFHLLSEFDDGKRSCRRRLAGHNERRRKPQYGGVSDKTHKFSHSYTQDARYLENPLQKRTPFVFSGILPEKPDQVNHFNHIKFENGSIFNTHPLATTPFTDPQFLLKTINAHPHGHSAVRQHRGSEIPSLETEDYFFHKSLGASTNAPCALSLLSAESQSFSSSMMLQNVPNQPVPQLSDRISRLRHGLNGIYPLGMDQLEPMVAFPTIGTNVDDFEAVSNGPNYGIGPVEGSTVNLHQLSSQLQRVEHQRNFMQVKQENEEFCCFQTA